MREQENLKYQKTFRRMSQKRKADHELTEVDIRRTEVVNKVYLGGKVDVRNLIYLVGLYTFQALTQISNSIISRLI